MQISLGFNHLKQHGGQKSAKHPKGRPLSAKTRHAVFSLMRQFFKQLIVWKTIDAKDNPMLGVKAPSLTNDLPVEVLTPDEYNRLLARLENTRYHAMAVFGGESGMRCGELLALRWVDIDLKSGDCTVSKSLQQTKSHGLRVKGTKTKKIRVARVSQETLAALLEHRRVTERDKQLLGPDYHDHGLVFPAPTGEHLMPKQVSGRMSQFMKDVGIQKTLHRLRHFCASVRLSNGESPVAVAAHLGHDPYVLQKIYAHVMPGDRERGVEIWQKAMREITKQKPEPPQPQAVMITPKKPVNSENVITDVIMRRLQIASLSNKSA
jgi:integrase